MGPNSINVVLDMTPTEELVYRCLLQKPGQNSLQISTFLNRNNSVIRTAIASLKYAGLVKTVKVGQFAYYNPIVGKNGKKV